MTRVCAVFAALALSVASLPVEKHFAVDSIDATPNYTAVMYQEYSLKDNDDLQYWVWYDQKGARSRQDETWLDDPDAAPASTMLSTCVPNPDKSSKYDKLIWQMTIAWKKGVVGPDNRKPPQNANFTADMVDSCSYFESAPREFKDCVESNGWAPLHGQGLEPYLGRAKCMSTPLIEGGDCVQYYSVWPDGQLCIHPDSGKFMYEVTDEWGWIPNGFETHNWIRNDQLQCEDDGTSSSFKGWVPKTELPASLVEDFVDRIKTLGVHCPKSGDSPQPVKEHMAKIKSTTSKQ